VACAQELPSYTSCIERWLMVRSVRRRPREYAPYVAATSGEDRGETRLALTPQRGRVPRMRVPKESPDEKSLRGQGWENLNAGVRSQPYKITMSRRLLLWHIEHLPRMK
jgi:hypothetical protein